MFFTAAPRLGHSTSPDVCICGLAQVRPSQVRKSPSAVPALGVTGLLGAMGACAAFFGAAVNEEVHVGLLRALAGLCIGRLFSPKSSSSFLLPVPEGAILLFTSGQFPLPGISPTTLHPTASTCSADPFSAWLQKPLLGVIPGPQVRSD